jgi:hypothetical protein
MNKAKSSRMSGNKTVFFLTNVNGIVLRKNERCACCDFTPILRWRQTCNRENAQVPHPAQVLQTEVPDLVAPPAK